MTLVFTIRATVASPSALCHLPDPVFLLRQPVDAQHRQINSTQHCAVRRQGVPCPLAPSSLLGPRCAFGVKSGEATSQACGRIALRQTQRWQAPSSSMDLPASVPGGHEGCSGVDLSGLTFPSMAWMRNEWPAASFHLQLGVGGAECEAAQGEGVGAESKMTLQKGGVA